MIRERLARSNSESPDYASEMGGVLHNMSRIDVDRRQFIEARDKLTRAVEWQRKALGTNSNHPTYRKFLASHLNGLIRVAQVLGRVDEADKARRELAELAATDPARAALDERLAAVLKGVQKPKNDAERMQLAYRAYEKASHAASARLFAEALANDPKLADDRQAQHRYNAACAAALADAGQGKDEPPIDDDAKARLRLQARDWLRAELDAWAKVVESGPDAMKAVIALTLRHWKVDADLMGVREEKALAKLPEAERADFQGLWRDVDALLGKAAGGR